MNSRASILCALLCAAACRAGAPEGPAWKPAAVPIASPWAARVSPDAIETAYPRPQMRRERWQSLDGLWQLREMRDGDGLFFGRDLEERVLVPFPLESSLSGVGRSMQRALYRRLFDVPDAWAGERILLHFGAVDWRAAVWIDGTLVGTHAGGYVPFELDVSAALRGAGEHELQVEVFDPSDAGDQPRGKQVRAPEGIWYTPSTGIWQSVWLEPAPAARVTHLTPRGSFSAGELRLTAELTGARSDDEVEAVVRTEGREVARQRGPAGAELVLELPEARAWSPDEPFLYDLEVRLLRGAAVLDSVASYFGLRDLELRADAAGLTRLWLNGEPLFQIGLLDQGFWPEGLYAAPGDAALAWDIQSAKDLGFNLLRKHVKVEPARWYAHCDRIGMLVWQDMPSGNNVAPSAREGFERELGELVRALEGHPSIVQWVVFNEGWGQYDTERLVARVRDLDPTRWIGNASGWTDQGVGDVLDIHVYPGPAAPPPEAARAGVLGEFGGLGLGVEGHTWEQKTWGYRDSADALDLTRSYEALLREAWRLHREQGLSAAIYTQLSDVESECNGLWTYDRAVLKVDAQRVRRANRGEFAELVAIAPTSERSPVVWRYRFDPPGEGWSAPDLDESTWSEGPGGFGTEGTPGAVVGTTWNTDEIWLRRRFDWNGELPGPLALRLHHDEDAEVFLNGVSICKVEGYSTAYEHRPLDAQSAQLLRKGENVLAVHCRQTRGGQFIDAGLCAEVAGD